MRGTPSSPVTAAEIARMIRAPGKITFIGPKNDLTNINDIVAAVKARVDKSGGVESFTKTIEDIDCGSNVKLVITISVKPGTITSPSKLLKARIARLFASRLKSFTMRFGDPLSLTSAQYQELRKLYPGYSAVFDSLEKMGVSTQGSATALLDSIQAYNKNVKSKRPPLRGPANTSSFTIPQLEAYYKYYQAVLNTEVGKKITSDDAKKLEALQSTGDPEKDKLVDLEGILKQLGLK